MAERKIPVRRDPTSLIDSEFDSIRDRFEQEMKKMEDEMSRFKSRLQDRENEFFGSSLTHHKSSSHSSSLEKHRSSDLDRGMDTWLDDLKSPLVQDTGDGKMLKLRFDVTKYAPEEIVVKTIDNRLRVQAKHEEKSENRSVYREYNREFLLPRGVNPEMIRSSLSKDGVLTVEAPLPALENAPGERRIPISHY